MSDTVRNELAAAAQHSPPLRDPGSAFRPLALRSMFWRPAYLEPSPWLEHIPFAFWLVEAQQPAQIVELGANAGASFFAFCHAIDRLGLDAKCFAVDPWDAAVDRDGSRGRLFAKMAAYNEAHYSSFARLVRCRPDEAADQFAQRSVDLLHLRPLHSLETARATLGTWLPKLSDRGLLLLHGTNVRERRCGAHRLFEQFQTEYPVFEFHQGHGLGVVGIGANQNDLLDQLFQSHQHPMAKRALHEVFSRLGRACADSMAATERLEQVEALTAEVQDLHAQLQASQAAREQAEVARARTGQGPGAETVPAVKAAAPSEIGKPRRQREREPERDGSDTPPGEAAPAAAARRRDEIERRFAELAQLTQRLDEAHQTQVELEKQLAQNAPPPAAKPPPRQGLPPAVRPPQPDPPRRRSPLRWATERARALGSRGLLGRLLPFRHRGGDEAAASQARILRRQVKQLRDSGLFHEQWYRERYPDAARRAVDPVEHYLRFGAAEGCDPSPWFSTGEYLRAYPDVAAANFNPLLHYLLHGEAEGRRVFPAQ